MDGEFLADAQLPVGLIDKDHVSRSWADPTASFRCGPRSRSHARHRSPHPALPRAGRRASDREPHPRQEPRLRAGERRHAELRHRHRVRDPQRPRVRARRDLQERPADRRHHRPANAQHRPVYDCGVTQGDVQVFQQADLPGRTFATYTGDTLGDGTRPATGRRGARLRRRSRPTAPAATAPSSSSSPTRSRPRPSPSWRSPRARTT